MGLTEATDAVDRAAARAAARTARLQASVLAWYAANGRDLAFRGTSDPWAILVSEVMAQQTQAARAAEAWSAFTTRYPTPAALAAVSPAEVVRAWRGLGYNRRAVALREAAVAIVADHRGAVPDSLEALRSLPGIGPYTARAVLAIAFGRPLAALDTNVRRVLGRVFDRDPRPPAAQDERALQAFADELVPNGRSADWTHALMDVGATLCRPRTPDCGHCPIAGLCAHARRGNGAALAAFRPARSPGAAAFPSTSRWLRGRIVDRLRDAPDGAWVTFDAPIGTHPIEAVGLELSRLARDGILERMQESMAARLVSSR